MHFHEETDYMFPEELFSAVLIKLKKQKNVKKKKKKNTSPSLCRKSSLCSFWLNSLMPKHLEIVSQFESKRQAELHPRGFILISHKWHKWQWSLVLLCLK